MDYPYKHYGRKESSFKKILVYILESTVKYMRKILLVISISHVTKVPYAWDPEEIYKAGSSI